MSAWKLKHLQRHLRRRPRPVVLKATAWVLCVEGWRPIIGGVVQGTPPPTVYQRIRDIENRFAVVYRTVFDTRMDITTGGPGAGWKR